MSGENAKPYPGLRPFRRDELSLFFGREEQVDQLVEKLGRSRFLGVVGISGCGKSSLVTAGLIPALQSGFLAAAGARWRVAPMRPGNHPMRRLAEALLEADGGEAEGPVESSAAGPSRDAVEDSARASDSLRAALLEATLRRSPLGLTEALADSPLPPRTNLLLLVDQFEEIFRYHQHGNREEADAFVALLLATARQSALPIYVVLTMRSDFLGDCAIFDGLPEALNDSQFLTPRLSREQRRASILGPAGVFGGRVEPALVNRLLNDMGEEPDQLPLMQHVLMRLWDETAATGGGAGGGAKTLTLESYRRVGGFHDALSEHLDEAYGTLDQIQQGIAETMFRGLSERGAGQSDTRRPATLGEIAAVAGAEVEEVAAVVEEFRAPGRSFLTPPAGVALDADSVLDISHESLIRQWRRMQGWVEREAISAELYRRLLETARLWREGNAGLWGAPDLDLALAWRERQTPTAAWAERYGGNLELVKEFFAASVQKRRDEEEAARAAEQAEEEGRRVRQRSVWLAVGLASALALASLVGWEAWLLNQRGHQSQVSLVLSRAQVALGEYPQRSLLLAAEALDMSRRHGIESEVVRQTLQEALTNVGGDPLVGHTGGVLAVAVSPDGRWIATAGTDGQLLLWPLEGWSSGAAPPTPVRLEGHRSAISALAFSASGKRLASGGDDRSVRLWDLSAAEPPSQPEVVLESRDSGVTALAFSPDGRWLTAGVYNKMAVLWDLRAPLGGQGIALSGHVDVINAVAIGPESRWLVTASADNTLRRWDLSAGAPTESILNETVTVLRGHQGPVLSLAISGDGRLLASGSADNTTRLWQLQAPEPNGSQIVLAGAESGVASVALSPDGRWLVGGSSDKTARLWDLSSPGRLPPPIVLSGHVGPIERVAISPDSRWLVTASRDKTARLWNLDYAEVAETAKVLQIHDKPLNAIAISADSRWLVTGSEDRTARRWNLVQPFTNAPSAVLSGHADTVRQVVVAVDGKWMATASDDNTARVWTLNDRDPGLHPRVLRGHYSAVVALAASPDGRWLATASDDNTARLWDLAAEDPSAAPRVLRGHESSVFSVDFHPAGRWLATGGTDGTVRLWDRSGDPSRSDGAVRVLRAGNLVAVVRFSPDGERLAAGGADGVARVWERVAWEASEPASSAGSDSPPAQLPAEPLILQGHTAPIPALAFTLDSRRLLTASWDRTARVWELGPSRDRAAGAVTVLRGHRGALTTLALSPDGTLLATASRDATVRLWPLAEADPEDAETVLRGHQDQVTSLAFSERGRWLLSGSADETARLWDLEAEDPSAGPGILLGHQGPVTTVAIGPGNQLLITGSEDDDARLWKSELWQLESGELVARACKVAGRNLTRGEWDQLLPGRKFHEICGRP